MFICTGISYYLISRPRRPLDGTGDQSVEVQRHAEFLQEGQLPLRGLAIRRGHLAGQQVGRLPQPRRQRVADHAAGQVEAVGMFQQGEAGLGDPRDVGGVEIAEDRL